MKSIEQVAKAHQLEGIDFVVERPACALFDEMGVGKTFQTIGAARRLFLDGKIDKVIVVSPAPVRGVWFDPDTGELAKWHDLPLRVIEYHSKDRAWQRDTKGNKFLTWVVTNFEYLRANTDNLLEFADERTFLVIDESSAIKNHKAKQTKAVKKVRGKCGRVLLLNGTPIANNPGDLYSQMDILSPVILRCTNWFQFRARYAYLGGYQGKQVLGWYHPFKPGCCDASADSTVHVAPGYGIDELQQLIKPYVLRREKEDCLDLPPKLPPVTVEVKLTPKTWKVYKQLRYEFLTWLDEATSAQAAQAGVRAMRLAQITSGFLGGLEKDDPCDCGIGELPSDATFADIQARGMCEKCGGTGIVTTPIEPQEVGTEKFDAVMSFLEQRFAEGEKILIWCRFRWEVARFLDTLQGKVPVEVIWGDQKADDRQRALRLLHPKTAPPGAAAIVGTPASGSMGLNLTAAWSVVYVSNDYSLKTRLQSEDRVHRLGQTRPVSYFDFVATGPKGQRTSDHLVVKSLRAKKEIAKMTIDAWRREFPTDE